MSIILPLIIGRFELYVLIVGLISALAAKNRLSFDTQRFLIFGCALGCLSVITNVMFTYALLQKTIDLSVIEIAPIQFLIQLFYAIAIGLIIYAPFAKRN